jgi:hypothetical protein
MADLVAVGSPTAAELAAQAGEVDAASDDGRVRE